MHSFNSLFDIFHMIVKKKIVKNKIKNKSIN